MLFLLFFLRSFLEVTLVSRFGFKFSCCSNCWTSSSSTLAAAAKRADLALGFLEEGDLEGGAASNSSSE